jgi:L-malate glycosyltransferase
MIKVLHVLSSLKLGGAERFVIDLARLQNEKGLEALILSFGTDADILVEEAKAQRIVVRVCDLGKERLKNYGAIFKLFFQMDVIHIHSPHALRALFLFVAFFWWKKVVYTRHGLSPLTAEKWKALHVFLIPFLHKITFVAKAGLESFVSTYGFNEKKMLTIENGVYIPHIQHKVVEGGIRFGSVGRMVLLKGQHHLLAAIKELELLGENDLSTFSLSFFGSGPEEANLRLLTSALTNAERVAFAGTVIDREAIYRAIDVLIVCSESEGFSLVIMEAMARGIPVIATKVGGNPILVKNERTGLLVDFADIQQLKTAILSFLRTPQKVLLYGENARRFITDEYSLEKTYAEYLSCYSK